MATTPATLVDGVLTTAATMNTHTTAITELQTTINAQSVMELTSTATQSIPNATWTAVTFSATPTYTNGSGNLTGTTGGITVAVAGRYILEGIAIFVANGTGSRLISINTVAAGIGSTTIQTSTVGNAGTASSMNIANELSVAAGATMALYVYQTSTVALNIGIGSRLIVRQMTS
jgi:hypothetical protein